MQLLETLCVPLKWQMFQLMGDILDTFRDFIEYSTIDFSKAEECINYALQYILSIDAFTTKEISVAQYLELKQSGIAIAGTLYRKCEETRKEIPSILSQWKAIAEDENEFGDIRNRWHKQL